MRFAYINWRNLAWGKHASEVETEMCQKITFPGPGNIRLPPTYNRWAVNLIEYRKTQKYKVIGRPTYIVTITTVTEYLVQDENIPESADLSCTVLFNNFSQSHVEVTVRYATMVAIAADIQYTSRYMQ